MFLLKLPCIYVLLRITLVYSWKNTFPNPANIYQFKVNNRNTRKRPDICSKLTVKLPERCHWGRSCVSLLTLNYFTPFASFLIVEFIQVNVCWENYLRFYSFDIYFNVSTGERQDLTRSNAGNSVIFLSHRLSEM